MSVKSILLFSFGCSCVLILRCILDILPPHLSCAVSTHGELCLCMLGVCACYESRDAMLYASVEVSEYVIVSNEIKFRFFLVCPPLCSGVCSQLLSWYLSPVFSHAASVNTLSIVYPYLQSVCITSPLTQYCFVTVNHCFFVGQVIVVYSMPLERRS